MDAPQWGKEQHINFYLEAVRSWAKINHAFTANELIYSMCSSLERSDKHEVADIIRVRYSVDDMAGADSIKSIEEVCKMLLEKFGRTKRDEIENYYNLFKSHRPDDEDVLKTILKFESNLQGLRNFGIEIDQRIAVIQLLQNCRLSSNEIQQIKSLAGNFESSNVLRKTISSIKEISISKKPTEEIFFGNFNRSRFPKNNGGYRDNRRSRSQEPKSAQKPQERRRTFSNNNADRNRPRPNFKTEMEKYLYDEISNLKRSVFRSQRPSQRGSTNRQFIQQGQEQETVEDDVFEGQIERTDVNNFFSSCDIFLLSDVVDFRLYAIVDTGCTRSCMSEETFNRIKRDNPPSYYRIQKKEARFRFGPSRRYAAENIVQLSLNIAGCTYNVSFYIIPANIPILMGNDIIRKALRGIIDTDQSTLQFKARDGTENKVDLTNLTSGHYALELNLTNLKDNSDSDCYLQDVNRGGEGPGRGKWSGRPNEGRRRPGRRRRQDESDGEGDAEVGRGDEHADEVGELRTARGLEDVKCDIQEKGQGEEQATELEGLLTTRGKSKDENIITCTELIKLHEKYGHRASLWDNIKYSSRILPMHKKMLDDIRSRCNQCIKHSKAQPKNKASFLKALEFNECVSLDLKDMMKWNRYILYCVCEFSKLTKGIVLKDKTALSVLEGFNKCWIIGQGMGPGIPTRMLADNGKEFTNEMLSEFLNKLGVNLKFSAFYSPFQNGTNERNHSTVDILVEKLMADDANLKLQDAVDMACYSKNIEINRTCYSSLQVIYGSNPKVINNSELTPVTADTASESEQVRRYLNRLQLARKAYRQIEVDERIKMMLSERMRAWNNYIFNRDDMVYFKNRKELWKKGKVICTEGQIIHILSEGNVLKVPKCNVRPDDSRAMELEKRGILQQTLDAIIEEETPSPVEISGQEDEQKARKVSFQPTVLDMQLNHGRPKVGQLVEIHELDGQKFRGKVIQIGKQSGRYKNFIWVADNNDTWIYDTTRDMQGWRPLTPDEDDVLFIDKFDADDFTFVELIPSMQ